MTRLAGPCRWRGREKERGERRAMHSSKEARRRVDERTTETKMVGLYRKSFWGKNWVYVPCNT